MCLWTRLTSVQLEETRLQTYKPNFQDCWDLHRDDVPIDAGTVHYREIILFCESGVMRCCHDNIKDCPPNDFPQLPKVFHTPQHVIHWCILLAWMLCRHASVASTCIWYLICSTACGAVTQENQGYLGTFNNNKKTNLSLAQKYWCELQTSSHLTYVIVLLSLVHFRF